METNEPQTLAPIRVERERCVDFERSSHLEWLETNGSGGFAMGTVAGANTRRYHGLLVASLRPPVERHVLLSRLEEVVEPDLQLATNAYPDAIHPQGYRNLIEFRLDPFPTWVFGLPGGAGSRSRSSSSTARTRSWSCTAPRA